MKKFTLVEALVIIATIAILAGLLIPAISLATAKPKPPVIGKVVDKEFIAAHTTTTLVYNAALKTSTPHTVHHPDAWQFIVYVNGKFVSADVTLQIYSAIEKQEDCMVIEYEGFGGFTRYEIKKAE